MLCTSTVRRGQFGRSAPRGGEIGQQYQLGSRGSPNGHPSCAQGTAAAVRKLSRELSESNRPAEQSQWNKSGRIKTTGPAKMDTDGVVGRRRSGGGNFDYRFDITFIPIWTAGRLSSCYSLLSAANLSQKARVFQAIKEKFQKFFPYPCPQVCRPA